MHCGGTNALVTNTISSGDSILFQLGVPASTLHAITVTTHLRRWKTNTQELAGSSRRISFCSVKGGGGRRTGMDSPAFPVSYQQNAKPLHEWSAQSVFILPCHGSILVKAGQGLRRLYCSHPRERSAHCPAVVAEGSLYSRPLHEHADTCPWDVAKIGLSGVASGFTSSMS